MSDEDGTEVDTCTWCGEEKECVYPDIYNAICTNCWTPFYGRHIAPRERLQDAIDEGLIDDRRWGGD